MARAKKTWGTTANLGFEAKLWVATHLLRNNHRHLLDLIFLKYPPHPRANKSNEGSAREANAY